MNHTTALASTALATARSWNVPFVIYKDPELGGYGTYPKSELAGKGAWCLPYVVFDSTVDSPDAAIEQLGEIPA